MAPKKGAAAGKNPSSKKPAPTVPDSEHIVFTNKPNDKKRDNKEPEGPPRPDARKVIGGASWTGKLPVNLLSEHCQRQRWNKPDYQSRQVPSGSNGEKMHRSWVVLSKTDTKTQEITRLPPFQLPASHAHLADQPTALEARHFAAAYTLFRVCSMKNLAMALPPTYRDLWKGEFQRLKDEDVKEGRAWKYEADPFAAEAKRQEIKTSMEKRRQDHAKQAPKLESPSLVAPGSSTGNVKGWDNAPRIELGESVRTRMEALIRSRSIWNPHGVKMTEASKRLILSDLTKSGFQPKHVEEALDYCGSREEAVEWLLTHVPEDSLPAWSFPPGYSAGVSLVSSDLAMDGKIKRLTEGGYPTQVAIQALRDNDGNEGLALEALQMKLVSLTSSALETTASAEDIWTEEMTTLEAILDDRFTLDNPNQCSIRADPNLNIPAIFQFRRPTTGYPSSRPPLILVKAPTLPSYVRLSITKKAVTYAQENLLGDQMIFSLLEWLETNIPSIIADPGRLSDLQIIAPSLKAQATLTEPPDQAPVPQTRTRERIQLRDHRTDKAILDAWTTRQRSEAQEEMNTGRRSLPAWSKKDAIIEAVKGGQVTLITGETGSGKSTQAIQFILDDAIQSMKGSKANLICTQPRRVAALSLSDRVSSERCSTEGDEVGYSIRGDSKVSSRTKITFMTTGVLLRRLQSSTSIKSALANISHIFVDEVHERSLDTDFLLALLRDAITALPQLKIVLMSATLNADTFAQYFGGDNVVNRVHIEGRTYPVQDYYLDDVVRLVGIGSQPSTYDPESSSQTDVGRAIQSLGMGINYQLIASLVHVIDEQLGTSTTGGILIFMPGTMEIDRCLRLLNDSPRMHGLPLHASLTPAEQRLVFRPAPRGKRKVVVATNVAETSITIEDIVAVIDTGKVKETHYDPTSNIVRLEEVWASQAACKQRRGRAGRVQAGKCYKLFTKNVEANMAPAAAPEMHRTPLEQLCLSVKATGSDRNVEAFLASTISPPDSRAVATAMKTLRRMGALELETDSLTGLGTYLAMIPADLRCAKLLVYGVLFDCLEPCLTIAAILTTKSPFVSPREKRDEAKAARASFGVADGDLLLDCMAFEQWKEMLSLGQNYRDMQDWCSARFLSQQTLRDIDSTRRQLLDSLIETGLLPPGYRAESSSSPPGPQTQTYNRNKRNTMLLRALIAGALNPQLARIQMPDKKYIASMTGAKELDPDARTIKYFNEENGRVFVHPSSVLFDAQSFSGAAAFVSYFTKMETSKTFIRDLTPFNAYALLLFGGPVEVQTSGAGVLVDGWLKLRGWARIGVLVSRLRALLDDELTKRIDSPGAVGDDGGILDIVRHLVELNGQDK
ncbi:putative ATP-dependent RNA helicase ucp12 [Exophiala dermatitidis]|uniref:ATP-dependent RNA helicase ucp12 n=1 Tax=Exophiala dermatitidis TaxID=5970 RepID=A0AAN6ISF8_EXODE|nr:putative ATP-dependent RNA helicase ucp12 [Exophiala dermatitidis]KAJ4512406.1 putative ATP-dependent RNA helicase ucp12 [Exophiala dermatitidis]KAJ4512720.1 putative ATP-dependent RNA helicase ucp12 [Exophiala dermatitidis]KAJ4542524.1 putative ATP-dependent RNA helicase ucp12 [Exophiala dermatitidis]KAJ4546551.1 putative ATP-dependent RNA helicase ucp12 [Exophiala dermatitidis]